MSRLLTDAADLTGYTEPDTLLRGRFLDFANLSEKSNVLKTGAPQRSATSQSQQLLRGQQSIKDTICKMDKIKLKLTVAKSVVKYVMHSITVKVLLQ